MPRRFLIIAIALGILLAIAGFTSYRMWTGIAGDGGMNGNGLAALVIGAIGSLALGGGLMILVFFSSRRGYDDRAGPVTKPIDP